MQAEGEHQSRIFDSEFRAENLRFKASDDMPGYEVSPGTNFSIFLVFDDSAKQQQIFEKLLEGGQVQFPLENNFGMLTGQIQSAVDVSATLNGLSVNRGRTVARPYKNSKFPHLTLYRFINQCIEYPHGDHYRLIREWHRK